MVAVVRLPSTLAPAVHLLQTYVLHDMLMERRHRLSGRKERESAADAEEQTQDAGKSSLMRALASTPFARAEEIVHDVVAGCRFDRK